MRLPQPTGDLLLSIEPVSLRDVRGGVFVHPSGFSCQLALVVCVSRSPERKHPTIGSFAANPDSHFRPMLRFVSHTPKPSALNAALLQGLIFKSITFNGGQCVLLMA